MGDYIEGEYEVVEPAYRPPRFRWFTALYTAAFYAACIYGAVTQDDPALRGGMVLAAITFGPLNRFFGQVAQKVPAAEAEQLRSRLLSRPASAWGQRGARRDRA